MLANVYGVLLGIGYYLKLVENSILDLMLLIGCPQKVSFSCFRSLDPPFLTEFLSRGQSEQSISRSSPRRANVTRELSVLSLLEVVSNIVGVQPLIVV